MGRVLVMQRFAEFLPGDIDAAVFDAQSLVFEPPRQAACERAVMCPEKDAGRSR